MRPLLLEQRQELLAAQSERNQRVAERMYGEEIAVREVAARRMQVAADAASIHECDLSRAVSGRLSRRKLRVRDQIPQRGFTCRGGAAGNVGANGADSA